MLKRYTYVCCNSTGVYAETVHLHMLKRYTYIYIPIYIVYPVVDRPKNVDNSEAKTTLSSLRSQIRSFVIAPPLFLQEFFQLGL